MGSKPPISAPVFPSPKSKKNRLISEQNTRSRRIAFCTGGNFNFSIPWRSRTADLPATLWGRTNFWELPLKPINSVHG